MKEKNIKINNIYYTKKSSTFTIPNKEFKVVRKEDRKNKPNRYYNVIGNKVTANELTEIPCKDKKCPCEYHTGVKQ